MLDGRTLTVLARSHGDATIADLVSAIGHAEASAVATALNLVDDTRPRARALASELLLALPGAEQRIASHLIGFTGPPGVGKSTLISALIAAWRTRGLSVGVLAVDPSSPISGGALLGDRLRMHVPEDDPHVFIRSLSNRGTFGGLAPELLPMAAVMLAAFDRVVIETVGVGQREVDVSFAADTTCLVVQPGAGDSVQFLKAGIMEVPDLLVVNKDDLETLATDTRSQLLSCLSDADQRPVLSTSALQGGGVDALVDALAAHHTQLTDEGRLAGTRRRAQVDWVVKRLSDEFGSHGIELLGGRVKLHDLLMRCPTRILTRLQELRSLILEHIIPRHQTGTSLPARAASPS